MSQPSAVRCVRNIICSLLAVFVLLMLLVSYGFCDQTDVIPSITVKEEYNDNVYFSTVSRSSAFMTVFSPDLDLIADTENRKALLNAGMDAFLYHDNRQGESTALNHSFRGQYRIRLDPRFDIGAQFSYRVSNQPDQVLEQNGVVLDSARRSRQNYSADVGYDITELLSASLSYALTRDDYNTGVLVDTTSHNTGLHLGYDLGRWIGTARAIGDINAAYYTNKDTTTRNISVYAGASWGLSEIYAVTALSGGSYTRSDSVQLVSGGTASSEVSERRAGRGWVGKLSLTRTGELTRASLAISKDITVSAGRSGPSETTTVSADLSHEITSKLSARLSAGYQWDAASFSLASGGNYRQETIRIASGIRYAFSKDTNLNASYSYTAVALRHNGTDVARNLIFLGLTYRYPLFE